MSRPLLSRVAERLRTALWDPDLRARLDRIEGRLDGVEVAAAHAGRYPSGPVYLGDHLALVAARWGGKLVVDTTDRLLAPWLLLDGLWETHITGWFAAQLRPGQVFVDVGANIGYYTVFAGQLVGPSGRVVAIEAHPRLVELLRGNVVINGHHGHTSVWHRAAWSGADRLTFHQRSRYSANSSLASVGVDALRHLGDEEVQVEVDAVALDELLDDLPRLDLMKIDVEGAEVRALTGLERTLERHPEAALLIEWSPPQVRDLGESPEALLDLLAGHGFRLRLFEADLERVEPARVLELDYGNLLAER